MPDDRNAPVRPRFLQTPEALIDNPQLTDSALRLLQGLVKAPPRNARNSDVVARELRMGKDKTNAARKLLRSCGHWHSRKRQNAEGHIRDQRMASLLPLRTPEEVAAGWAAAEEAARLGKDTSASRRLGVRILNSRAWQSRPAAGRADVRADRSRLPSGGQERSRPDPPPAPRTARADAVRGEPGRAGVIRTRRQPPPLPDEFAGQELTGPLAPYAALGERTLLRLRRAEPRLALPHADARALAYLAGHHLLRGVSAESLLTVLSQGLPQEGVREPAAFVRDRLRRYMPPVPRFPMAPVTASNIASDGPSAGTPRSRRREPEPVATGPDEPVTRPGGPADLIAQGHSWRDVLAAARKPVRPRPT